VSKSELIQSEHANKKLAIFLPNLDGGGAERTMLNLAEGLVARGYNIELVLAQADGSYLENASSDLPIVDLGCGKCVGRFKTVRRLPALVRYLRKEKPTVLLSALTEANVVAIVARFLARSPNRVIVNEQNNLSKKTGVDSSGIQKWYPFLARLTYRYADYVVGVSQGVVDDLTDNVGISDANTIVLYNPGITPKVRENAKQPVDHPWFGSNQPPVILSVGRLHMQKDYGTLLEAFKLVRQKQAARLMILGDGEERQNLEKQIQDLDIADDVSLPGFVDNPHAYMSNAAVYVLSSRWEGLPTVLVEALYCGATLVATDCPSGPKEILQDGKLGCLVQMQNPESIADGIQKALDGTAPKVKPDSWRVYDLDIIIEQYIDLLFNDNQTENQVVA